MGLQSTRLHHRLSVIMSAAENHYSEPIDVDIAGTAFSLPPKKSGLSVQDSSGLPGIEIGTAYIADDDRLVSTNFFCNVSFFIVMYFLAGYSCQYNVLTGPRTNGLLKEELYEYGGSTGFVNKTCPTRH